MFEAKKKRNVSNIFIETPENLALEAEIAGFGSRFMAALLDYTLITLLMAIVTLLFLPSLSTSGENLNVAWASAIYGFIAFLVILFYHLLFEFFWNGQTPGKRRAGLRVVMSNGLPVTTGGALTRNLVRLFDFLPVFYGFGLVALFSTRYVQRLGDIAAGTIVIKERAELSLQSLREDYRVDYQHITRMSQLDPRVNVRQLGAEDRRILIGYLNRREGLSDLQRKQLSIGIARKLAALMRVAPPRETAELFPGVRSAETFLEQIARALEFEDNETSAGQQTTRSLR